MTDYAMDPETLNELRRLGALETRSGRVTGTSRTACSTATPEPEPWAAIVISARTVSP